MSRRGRRSRAPRSPAGVFFIGAVVIAGAIGSLFDKHQAPAPATPTPAPPAAAQTLYTPPPEPIRAPRPPPDLKPVPSPSRTERRQRGPQLLKPNQECGLAEYRNVDGMCIHRPYDSPHGGETAICRDSTHSMSAHHRGTCSHHGGVAVWE